MKNLSKLSRPLSAAAAATPKAPMMPQVIKKKHRQSTEYQHSECYSKCSDLTIAEGKGCWVWDTEGNKYLDVTSGIAVLSTGHCHPRVVEAIQEQAGKVIHGQLNCFKSHEQLDYLMENIGRMAPKNINRFVVDTTGTQAIEAAVKLARRHTGRPNIVCFAGGFHGRSALTSAMTSSNTGPRFPIATPLPSGVYHVDPPLAYSWGVTKEQAVERSILGLKELFASKVPADQVAAIIFEPVLGEGGFIPIEPEFARQVRELCDKHGILVICDEVQSGVGRTGKMWGHEHFGPDFQPDIFISAKGIASGMPISMVGATEEVMACYTPGTHGGTYMGNPVACAAANATLRVIEEEGLIENSANQGSTLKHTLQDLQRAYFPQGDVRGMGLMVGMEFRDEENKPSADMAKHIRASCLEDGVLLYGASGWFGNCLRIMPPLIIQEHEVCVLGV